MDNSQREGREVGLFFTGQISALDVAVVKIQNVLSSQRSSLTNPMYQQRETIKSFSLVQTYFIAT